MPPVGRIHVDGGWYEVDLVESLVEEGQITLVLDPDSLVIHRRILSGYWWAMTKVFLRWAFRPKKDWYKR